MYSSRVVVLVVFNLGHTEPKEYVTFDDEYYAPRSIAARELSTSRGGAPTTTAAVGQSSPGRRATQRALPPW